MILWNYVIPMIVLIYVSQPKFMLGCNLIVTILHDFFLLALDHLSTVAITITIIGLLFTFTLFLIGLVHSMRLKFMFFINVCV
jgi:hypothetical protein